MNIQLLHCVPPGSNRGNEITALRWRSLLLELSHEVTVGCELKNPGQTDCLVAIHAVHCGAFIQTFRDRFPGRPIFVCMSGTDLHGLFFQDPQSCTEDPRRETAIESMRLADRIILLEPEGQKKIPSEFQHKCTVIYQSAERVQPETDPPAGPFDVSVIGHLREVKDPLLAARASRLLPGDSHNRIIHVGQILEAKYQPLVEKEMEENPRYQWLGKLSHAESMQRLVNSKLFVLSSFHEGAPGVISEAVVNNIPVLASRIDATIGLLGGDYPGFFQAGNASELAALMLMAEEDQTFMARLRRGITSREHLFSRETERLAWQALLQNL